MSDKLFIFFASMALLLVSCMGSKDPSVASTEVEGVLKRLMQADNAGNLAAVISHYAADAVLMAPNAPSVRGIEKIKNHYRNLFDEFRFEGLQANAEDIRVGGDLAVIAGTNSGLILSKADSTAQEIHGKFIMQLVKETGQWKISRLIWNDAGTRENLMTGRK